jgi:hypothetical protein
MKSKISHPVGGSNSMGHSPNWKADSHSASQEILRLLWDPKVHYSVHRNPPLVHLLSRMNPLHTFPPYFPKIHSNISSRGVMGCDAL